jgi:hypothetical protein
VERDHIG